MIDPMLALDLGFGALGASDYAQETSKSRHS
jgi:hypothetical protein